MAEREVKYTLRFTAQGVEVLDHTGRKLGMLADEAQRVTGATQGTRASLDNMTRGMRDAANAAMGVGQAAQGVTRDVGDLGDTIRRQAESFGMLGRAGLAAFDAVRSGSIGAMVALGGVAVAGVAVGKALIDSGKYAQDVFLLSQQAGLAADEFTRLSYAATIAADITQSDLVVAMRIFSGKRDDAMRGNKEAVESFTRLGVNFAKPAAEAFEDVADAVANLTDKNEKVAVANDLFGRSGARLVPLLNEGADGVREFGDEAERMGIVIGDDLTRQVDELGDSADRVSAAMLGLKVAVLEVADSSGALDIVTASLNGLAAGIAAVRRAAGAGDPSNPGQMAGGFFGSLRDFEAGIEEYKRLRREQAEAFSGAQSPAQDFGASGVSPLPGSGTGLGFDPLQDGPVGPNDILFQRGVEESMRRQDDARRAREQAAREATRDAAREAKRAEQERIRDLAEQARIAETIFETQQKTSVLEAGTMAATAERRLDNASRGLDLETATVSQREALFALAREADQAERSQLEAERASLEAMRDRVEAAKDLNEELRGAQVALLEAQIAQVGEELDTMPSKVDELGRAFERAEEKAKGIGDTLSDSIDEAIVGILRGSAGPGGLTDAIKNLFEGLGPSLIKGGFDQAGGIEGILGLASGLFGGTRTTGAGNAAIRQGGPDGRFSGQDEFGRKFSSTDKGAVAGLVADGGTQALTSGLAAGAASFGIGFGLVALGEGLKEVDRLRAIPFPTREDMEAKKLAEIDPIQAGIFKMLGMKNALAQEAISSVATGGLTTFLNLVIPTHTPQISGLVGKQIEQILDAAGVQVPFAAGGAGSGSSLPFNPANQTNNRLFPLVPEPESFAGINRKPFDDVFAKLFADGFGTDAAGDIEYGIKKGPVQSLLNIAAGLGLGREDTEAMIRKVAGTAYGNFDDAIFDARRKNKDDEFEDLQKATGGAQGKRQREMLLQSVFGTEFEGEARATIESMDAIAADIGSAAQEDMRGTVEGLIMTFYDLPEAIDTARLSLLAFGEDGGLQVEALKRQIEATQATIEGGIGAAIRTAFEGGDTDDIGRAMGQEFGNAFLDALIYEILNAAGVKEALTQATIDARDLAAAIATGDDVAISDALTRFEDSFRSGAEDFQKFTDLVTPTLDQTRDFLGLTPEREAPVAAPTVPARTIRLPSFDVGGTMPGAIGQPGLAVVHGGETVLSNDTQRKMVSLLEQIANGIQRGKDVIVNVGIDDAAINRANNRAERYGKTGMRMVQEIGR